MTALQRVIVIAGPSCVGKSTLIGRLHRGEHRQIAVGLGLRDPDMWEYVNARNVPTSIEDPGVAGIVLHYDIVRPVMERHFSSFAEDPGLATALEASQLCFCTVWANGDLLRERAAIKTSERRRIDSTALCTPARWWMANRRMRRVCAWYRDDRFIRRRYEEWFAYLQTTHANRRHVILDANDPQPRLIPFAQWSTQNSTDHVKSKVAG